MYKQRLKHYINHYIKKLFFFTVSERRFYDQLHRILKEDYHWRYKVFANVRLWDIIDVHKDDIKKRTYENKIARRHIDFVLVDKSDYYRPILAIELNWSSHDNDESKGKDNYKLEVLKEAGIPLVFFKNGDDMKLELIKERISLILRK